MVCIIYFEYLRSAFTPLKEATDNIKWDIIRTFPRHIIIAMTSDDEKAENAVVGPSAVDAGQQPGLEEERVMIALLQSAPSGRHGGRDA